MSIDGLVAAYRIDTGEEVRIPPHWLDNPDLSKPFTTTPPTGPADTPADTPAGRGPTSPGTTPAPDLDKKKPTTTSTTETPAAGAKE